MSFAEQQVLIIGGGLAGLVCAIRLHEAGARPIIFEGRDRVGGRVSTDELDGFLLDRGFQVYLDAYPAVGGLLDLAQLDLRPFKPGALIYQTAGMQRMMDVFRAPRYLVQSALASVGSITDKLRVAALKWRLLRTTLAEIAGHEDLTTERYLQREGFSPPMIDGFFRAFYGGIFLERELQTSSRMFEFTFKMFSQGSATLPARGMEEIPRQLASRLPPGTIRLRSRVVEILAGGITLESGEQFQSDEIVVATDASTAARLTSSMDPTPPAWRSVTGLYFAAPRSPLGEPIIALNGTGSGLVQNLCVPSDLAPAYAPPGSALISVSVLGAARRVDLEGQVLAELKAWFGSAVDEWRHLRTYPIEHALPVQPPGKGMSVTGYDQPTGVYVCGDHLGSASIEGAIVSGLRTADAILQPA